MNVTGWEHLWHEAMALFAHEPVQVQIVLLLTAAFTALMVLEGLRASFFPRRKTATDIAPPANTDTEATTTEAGTLPPPYTTMKFSAPQHPPARTRISPKHKPAHPVTRRACVARPTIRRGHG